MKKISRGNYLKSLATLCFIRIIPAILCIYPSPGESYEQRPGRFTPAWNGS